MNLENQDYEKVDAKSYLEEVREAYKNLATTNLPNGMFVDSLTLSKLIGKRHDNVLRDLDMLMYNLEQEFGSNNISLTNFQKSLTESKFELSPEIHSENEFFVKEDHYLKNKYVDIMNRVNTMYYIDETLFICLIGQYDDIVNYMLAKFYLDHQNTRYVNPICLLNKSRPYLENCVSMLDIFIIPYRDTIAKIRYDNSKLTWGEKEDLVNQFENEFWPIYSEEQVKFDRYYTYKSPKEKFNEIYNFFTGQGESPMSENKPEHLFCTSKEIELMLKGTPYQKKSFHINRDIYKIIHDVNVSGGNIDRETYNNDYSYITKDGREVTTLGMNELGFLTLMSKYFVSIRYKLTKYYLHNSNTEILNSVQLEKVNPKIIRVARDIKAAEEDIELLNKIGKIDTDRYIRLTNNLSKMKEEFPKLCEQDKNNNTETIFKGGKIE